MHVCVIGTGAAGWMAAQHVARLAQKVTIIGSPHIPPIGVGESNTLALLAYHRYLNIDLTEFIRKSDATVKTGVYYKGWSKHNFIHNFKGNQPWNYLGITPPDYWQSMGNKPVDQPLHSYYGYDLIEAIDKNHFFPNSPAYQFSYHFDAGKYIQYLSSLNSNVFNVIHDTVRDVKFKGDEEIDHLILSNRTLTADYYIFATGQSDFNKNILKIKYNDLSNVLLTNKAWVYPLEFTNKREQFTPYTTAKTMKYGWRWITPTYSRIGTGYVFSNKHISEEEALQEFLDDIPNHDIQPRLVDFHPQYSQKTFYKNYCLIGMANGFLEPLDAPGLSLSIEVLSQLWSILKQNLTFQNYDGHYNIERANEVINHNYQFWASFILSQYKTSIRNDTQFWIDHKNVQYDFYDDIFYLFQTLPVELLSRIMNVDMFFYTTAAKDVQWNLNYKRKPFVIPSVKSKSIHHLDYIELFHK